MRITLALMFLLLTTVTVAAPPQSITVSPERLKLGDFRLGTTESLTGTVKVTNHTDAAMRIEELDVSCGCLQIVTGFQTLGPGATEEIELRVVPETGAPGISNKRLKIKLRGTHVLERNVLVNWTVSHPVLATPDKLVFSRMEPGQRRVQEIELALRTDDTQKDTVDKLAIENVHISYPFVTSHIIEQTENRARIQTELTMPRDFSPQRESHLVVSFKSRDDVLPKLRIPFVIAQAPADVLVAPRSISLFRKPFDDGSRKRIRIFRSDQKPLMIESVEVVSVDGNETGTRAEELAKPDSNLNPWSRIVELDITPMPFGTRETVRIHLNDASVDYLEVPIHHAYR
jgi:hypothetical protein